MGSGGWESWGWRVEVGEVGVKGLGGGLGLDNWG